MAGLILNERLKYFSRKLCNEGTVNILLVSTSQSYLEKIAKSLYSTREVQNEKRSYILQVHMCKSILEVLQFMSRDFYIDFIVFILDSHVTSCLAEVESNLNWLDSSFTREKLCLVNPDFSYIKSALSVAQIWDFARLHQLNLINGKTKYLKDQLNLMNLSKILKMLLNHNIYGGSNNQPLSNKQEIRFQKSPEHDDIFTLTRRILNLVESSCGILNGIPMINVV